MGFRDLSYPFLFPMPTRGIPTNPTIDAMVMEIKHPIDPIAFSAKKNGTPRSAQKRPSWFGPLRFTRRRNFYPLNSHGRPRNKGLATNPFLFPTVQSLYNMLLWKNRTNDRIVIICTIYSALFRHQRFHRKWNKVNWSQQQQSTLHFL